MMFLPDVNVWLAMAFASHVHHTAAKNWDSVAFDPLLYFRLMIAEIAKSVEDLGQGQVGQPIRDGLGRQALAPHFHDGADWRARAFDDGLAAQDLVVGDDVAMGRCLGHISPPSGLARVQTVNQKQSSIILTLPNRRGLISVQSDRVIVSSFRKVPARIRKNRPANRRWEKPLAIQRAQTRHDGPDRLASGR
jgi:hypothetical protein